MQLREAKAKLSEVVKSAEAGESTTITRHGLPVAKVVPIGESSGQGSKKTFGEFLLEFPGPIEIDKDRRPPREIDL
jgi:prevent-host-death family protein